MGDLLNIRKDPGVSRFEFEICIEKRLKLLKEMMDRHEIYSNKKPPPQKKSRKMLILRRRSWKPVKHWQKIGKNAGLSPGLNLLLNFLFNSDLFPFSSFDEKSNNQIIKKQRRYICLQIQILKLKCRQSAGH